MSASLCILTNAYGHDCFWGGMVSEWSVTRHRKENDGSNDELKKLNPDILLPPFPFLRLIFQKLVSRNLERSLNELISTLLLRQHPSVLSNTFEPFYFYYFIFVVSVLCIRKSQDRSASFVRRIQRVCKMPKHDIVPTVFARKALRNVWRWTMRPGEQHPVEREEELTNLKEMLWSHSRLFGAMHWHMTAAHGRPRRPWPSETLFVEESGKTVHVALSDGEGEEEQDVAVSYDWIRLFCMIAVYLDSYKFDYIGDGGPYPDESTFPHHYWDYWVERREAEEKNVKFIASEKERRLKELIE